MSKHEIRLRRHKLTSHGAERFRNYGALLQRHEQDRRMKKIIRVFTYFLVILIVIVLLVIVVRIEKRVAPKAPAQTVAENASKPLRHPSSALRMTEQFL